MSRIFTNSIALNGAKNVTKSIPRLSSKDIKVIAETERKIEDIQREYARTYVKALSFLVR